MTWLQRSTPPIPEVHCIHLQRLCKTCPGRVDGAAAGAHRENCRTKETAKLETEQILAETADVNRAHACEQAGSPVAQCRRHVGTFIAVHGQPFASIVEPSESTTSAAGAFQVASF